MDFHISFSTPKKCVATMTTKTTPMPTADTSSPNDNIMLYGDTELNALSAQLLTAKSKGKRGPKNNSQLLKQAQIALIRKDGRKFGIRLPARYL